MESASQKPQSSAGRFSSGTLDLIAAPVYAVDADGAFTAANAAFAELLGFRSGAELVGKNIKTVACDAESRSRGGIEQSCQAEGAIAKGAIAERAVKVEKTFRRTDGASLTVECSCHPLTDAGRPAGAIVTVLDMGTPKLLEREWQKLSALIDSSEDLIGMASADMTISFLNQGGAKMVGLSSPGQAVGRPVREFLTEEALRKVETEAWPVVNQGLIWRGELQLVSANGNVVDVLTNSFLVRHPRTGEILGQATVMRDITERKKSDRDRQMLASIVESTTDFVALASTDGRLTFLNEGGCKLAGLANPQDAIGLHISDFHTKEAWEKIQTEVLPAAALDGHWRGEVQLRHFKTGTHIDVLLSAFSVPTEDGNFALGAVMHDISERKRFEASLHQAKEAAEAASRAKSEFLANMSHEIRTPMNGILGMTELTLDTELTAEQRDFLETAKESADSLLRILNDILDFSKIEAGKLDLDPTDFDPRQVFGEVLKLLSPAAEQKGLSLSCGIEPSVPAQLRGDFVRLRQIVVNLVGNAIKFTHQGGVSLHVRGEAEGGDAIRLHVDVKDSGIGIAPDKLQAIFESFTQADGSMSRRYGGTGLGLTIAARLVQMMEGRIWVDSIPGAGSTFHFTVRLNSVPA